MGGSPCTHWSIAQKNNRETEPEGLGWELFKNFLIAKEKFKPDYFLYENNKSMAKPIRNQIDIEFNRTYAENTNWELVSTVEEGKGNTKRWLWRNKTTGKTEYITRILINSALVSAQNRQRYYWTNIPDVPQPADRGILLKDILESGTDLSQNEKGYALTTRCQGAIPEDTIQKHRHSMVAEPIRIGDSGSNSQGDRVYSPYGKSITLCGNGGGKGAKTGLYACPIGTTKDGKSFALTAYYSTGQNPEHTLKKSLGTMVAESWDGKTYPIYEVKNGLITIKDKQYPIKLPDGYYIIRKLTVLECCRLQTFPDNYFVKADGVPLVSNSQAYKQLGNSWTVEVIKHLLSYIPNLKDCDVRVLGMYDGISAGQLVLRELGANIVTYKAYEIDKYCLITTQYHFPNTIQCGDAFQVRNDEWRF